MPAYRADLTDRVISAEQGKPVALPARGKSIARWTDGDAGNGNGSKRKLPCNGADRGCVASWGPDHLAGNGADFLLVLSSRTLEEPMHEAKQMTMRKPLVRLHTQRAEFPPPCESAASQYRVGLLRFESGRVLVVQGGVFECSSRMNGKPSSPVLRGLGASDGARLLDSNSVSSASPVIRPQSSGSKWSGLTVGARCDAPDRQNAGQTGAGPRVVPL